MQAEHGAQRKKGSEISMSINAPVGWNVLCVAPGHERIAAAHLIRRDLVGYLPTIQCCCRVGVIRRRVFEDRPMFPGYLFLRSDHDRWHAVHAIPGFVRCLMDGDRPAELSEAAIAIVRETEAKLIESIQRKERKFDFKIGDLVRLVRPYFPFDGMSGLLQRLDKRDRAVIELTLPGRSVAIDTHAQWLRAVEN